MRLIGLPKLKHVGSAGMSSALIATAVALFGMSIGSGVTGALAQSATPPGTATTAGTDPVGSGGFGRGSGATPAMTGNTTPAFSSTPTPAFSGTPTPAFSGTPTPALSGTQTAPLGSTVGPTPIDGTSSADVTGTISADGDISVNVSPNGIAARRSGAAQSLQSGLPSSRVGSPAIVNSSAGSSGQKGPPDDGSAFIRSGGSRRAVSQTRFVIVTNTAAPDSPATTAAQFTMVCNNGVSCTTPPRFVMNEQ
ncbi:MAG: hypothetical protein ACREEV_19430 [Dongiaceae bacterium]